MNLHDAGLKIYVRLQCHQCFNGVEHVEQALAPNIDDVCCAQDCELVWCAREMRDADILDHTTHSFPDATKPCACDGVAEQGGGIDFRPCLVDDQHFSTCVNTEQMWQVCVVVLLSGVGHAHPYAGMLLLKVRQAAYSICTPHMQGEACG
jgi:hypothetical protein